MEHVRRVQKHFPTTTSECNFGQLSNFALKSIGQSWVEIHDSHHLVDVLSLPSFMKMTRLYHCSEGDKSLNPQLNHSTYMFACGRQLWVGQPNDNNMELVCKEVPLHEPAIMINSVRLNDRIANITTQFQNSHSCINIFEYDLQQELSIAQLQIGCTVLPSTNLVSNSPVIYSVSILEDEENRHCLIAYDMEKQALSLQLQLPQLQHSHFIKSMLLPAYKQTLCCVSSQYMVFIDTRTNTIINMAGLNRCQTATTLEGKPTSIYYADHNNVMQYDMRNFRPNTTPALAHPYHITDMSDIGSRLVKIEDQICGGINLYSYF